jgi:Arc/MetJ-type ribon-helix-helix transcriptional regulator
MVKKRGRKNKPPACSIPTYIRFTQSLLKEIDSAAKKGGYINASEFARDAVERLLKHGDPATKTR